MRHRGSFSPSMQSSTPLRWWYTCGEVSWKGGGGWGRDGTEYTGRIDGHDDAMPSIHHAEIQTLAHIQTYTHTYRKKSVPISSSASDAPGASAPSSTGAGDDDDDDDGLTSSSKISKARCRTP
jgi:hypothetical protein